MNFLSTCGVADISARRWRGGRGNREALFREPEVRRRGERVQDYRARLAFRRLLGGDASGGFIRNPTFSRLQPTGFTQALARL